MSGDATENIKSIADRSVDELMEYCDSVRIFVTFSKEGHDTASYETGKGNFYAQLGQVHEWVSMQDQFQRLFVNKKDRE